MDKKSWKEKLWNEWFAEWCKLQGCDEKKAKENPEILPFYQFYLFFKNSYDEAEEKIPKNRNKNFFWKRIFVLLQCVVVILQLLLTVWELNLFSSGMKVQNYLQVEVSLLILWFLLSLIVVKIIDIKKFQETWSRHSRFQFLRVQEMILFLFGEEPYMSLSNDEKARKFMKRMLEIEGQNINQFCENMEGKEKGLFEEVSLMTNTFLGKNGT